jgi:predicted CopG family antitoxin
MGQQLTTHRTTVHCSPKVYRALKAKAARTRRSFSELANEAIELAIREDTIDMEIFRRRKKEPSRAFSEVLRDLAR